MRRITKLVICIVITFFAVLLQNPLPAYGQETKVVVSTASANWRVTTAYPETPPPVDAAGNQWMDVNFDDSSWQMGVAPFGYGDEPRASYGTALPNTGGSYYFRKTFTIDDVSAYKDFVIELKVASDNSATVYLNGQEIDKDTGNHEFTYWNRKVYVDASIVRTGKNVVAVFLYNNPGSSDAYFDAEMKIKSGTLANVPEERVFGVADLLGDPNFTFVQITDSHIIADKNHPEHKRNAQRLREAIKEINALNPAFVIDTGDITALDTPEDFTLAKEIWSALDPDIAYYVVPGNHDVRNYDDAERASLDLYDEYYPDRKNYYFDYKNCRFIGLNTALIQNKGFRELHNDRDLDEEITGYIQNILEDSSDMNQVFIFSHYPYGNVSGLRKILYDYNVTAYMNGHRHKRWFTTEDNLTTFWCPAIGWNGEVPTVGYSIYYVYDDCMVNRYKVLGEPLNPLDETIALNPRVPEVKKSASYFKFVVIGDTRTQHDIYRRTVSLVKRLNPDFVVNTGDLVTDGRSDDQWETFFKISKPIIDMCPYYVAFGNHDIGFEEDIVPKVKKLFGLDKLYYSFDYKNAHFVLLNGYDPELKTTQLEWLQKDLRDNDKEHTFVFVHQPMYPQVGHYGDSLNADEAFRDSLNELFVEHRVEAVFTGHVHIYHRGVFDGLLQIITGGGGAPLHSKHFWSNGFYHVNVVEVSGDEVRSRVIPLWPITGESFTIEKPVPIEKPLEEPSSVSTP